MDFVAFKESVRYYVRGIKIGYICTHYTATRVVIAKQPFYSSDIFPTTLLKMR